MIYLDYNRTTPVCHAAIEAMKPFWATHFLLPSQEHPRAEAVAEAVEAAREQVAALMGAEPFEVVLTGGGTEANNLGILGHRSVDPAAAAGHAVRSAIENDSVQAVFDELRRRGWDVETVGVDADGRVDPVEFADAIRPETRIASVQLANPTLGTIQDIQSMAAACRQRDVPFHCDATAAAGRWPIDVGRLGVDTLSVSSHKFFGPKGAGALFVRRGLELRPTLFGSNREMGVRPGSENVPAVIGMGAAASLATACATDANGQMASMRDRLTQSLTSAAKPGSGVETRRRGGRILGTHHQRLPNTACVELPVDAFRVMKAAGGLVAARGQSSSPPDEITRTLRAVGCESRVIDRCLRISVGWTTTSDEILRAAEVFSDAIESVAGP